LLLSGTWRIYDLENAIVCMDNIVKKFGSVVAVDNISFNIFAGEFFSILGPSGCGKTSLLRLIAGLEKSDSGLIYLNGNIINQIPPYRRDVNMVFQNYALFPHMNVYENISFGLKLKGMKKNKIDEKVSNILETVGLIGMGSRRPGKLSGGEQQRVALARALVNEPSVLLLDEPLGALDLKLRKQMQLELKSLQKKLGITFIYVTHDQEEALTMSDRIAIMNLGKLEQLGTPLEVYEHPQSEFVANFIGISNIFSGSLTNGSGSVLLLTTPDGLEIKALQNGLDYPKEATAMVRPEKIQITIDKPKNGDNSFYGEIEDMIYLGTVVQFIMNLNGRKLTILEKNQEKNLRFSLKQKVFASWDISNTVIMPKVN
jgi:spermidine/putrescine transport system ATP-binding protein